MKTRATTVSFMTLVIAALLVTTVVGYTARKAQRSANDATAAATYVRGLVKTVADLAAANKQAIIRINQGTTRATQLTEVAKSVCDQVKKTQRATNEQIAQQRSVLKAMLSDQLGLQTDAEIRAQLPRLHLTIPVNCGQILKVATTPSTGSGR